MSHIIILPRGNCLSLRSTTFLSSICASIFIIKSSSFSSRKLRSSSSASPYILILLLINFVSYFNVFNASSFNVIFNAFLTLIILFSAFFFNCSGLQFELIVPEDAETELIFKSSDPLSEFILTFFFCLMTFFLSEDANGGEILSSCAS